MTVTRGTSNSAVRGNSEDRWTPSARSGRSVETEMSASPMTEKPTFFEPLVLHGDCLDILREIPDSTIDAIVTDPPYGLEFMGREWDSFKPSKESKPCATPTETAPTTTATTAPDASGASGTTANAAPAAGASGAPTDLARAASATIVEADAIGGFQDGNGGNAYSRSRVRTNTQRHGGDSQVANRGFGNWCEAWSRECLRVLKPGGHMLAFGGTRTWHRLACAVEDAGFEVRDSIAWLYGSGFPKSMDVSKAIDKAGGASPEVQSRVLSRARKRSGLSREEVAAHVGCTASSVRDWEEGRARATGRAVEFITPSPAYREALADLLGYTTDERAIVGARLDRRGDGTVIGLGHSGVEYGGPATDAAQQWTGWGTALKPAHEPIVVARKPLSGTVAANVLEHGTGALNIDACRVEGEPWTFTHSDKTGRSSGILGESAAREGVAQSHPAGRWPANVVLDDSQAAALDRATWGMVGSNSGTPGKADGTKSGVGDVFPMGARVDSGAVYDQRGTGGASRFFYCAKAPKKERPVIEAEDGTRTVHPTVKPLTLMRWLIRLVTPPGGVVLDPFVGSGTTIEAGMLEGFEVWGIEGEEDYLPLIQQRIDRVKESSE